MCGRFIGFDFTEFCLQMLSQSVGAQDNMIQMPGFQLVTSLLCNGYASTGQVQNSNGKRVSDWQMCNIQMSNVVQNGV